MRITDDKKLNIAIADLIAFISDVAIAIRMNTRYNGFVIQYTESESENVMWLSDIIHELYSIADAIKHDDKKAMCSAANLFVKRVSLYKTVSDGYAEKIIDEHLEYGVSVDRAIKIGRQIELSCQ